eukprot:3047500-Lingulodinium_polyedra.AAC.1
MRLAPQTNALGDPARGGDLGAGPEPLQDGTPGRAGVRLKNAFVPQSATAQHETTTTTTTLAKWPTCA